MQEQSVMVVHLCLVWKYNLVASETGEEFCVAETKHQQVFETDCNKEIGQQVIF